jgi:hypothetical protein
MTIKEIKSMFAVGQKWSAVRSGGKPLTIHGNAGTTVLPSGDATEIREVNSLGSREITWQRPAPSPLLFTKWPLSSEVIEARPGYLKFAYDNGITLELTKI